MSTAAPALATQDNATATLSASPLQDAEAAERAWKFVLSCYAGRRVGHISTTDPIAHATLQALRGYALLKAGLPGFAEAVQPQFIRLYPMIDQANRQLVEQLAQPTSPSRP